MLQQVDTPTNVIEGLFGVWQRQQVVQMPSTRSAPAQMLGYEARLVALDHPGELAHVLEVQRVGRAQTQTDAVQTQRVVGANALQPTMRLPALAEVVFAVHLDPAQRGARVDDVAEVRRAQADPAANWNR